MSNKVTGYTFWSNERRITEPGQIGVIQSRIFNTPEEAKNFYAHLINNKEQVLIKVTAEVFAEELPDG